MKAIVYGTGNGVEVVRVRVDREEGNGRVERATDGATIALVLPSKDAETVRILRTRKGLRDVLPLALLGLGLIGATPLPLLYGAELLGLFALAGVLLIATAGLAMRVRYEPCVSVREDDLRPLVIAGDELREVRYAPAVYDGAIRTGALTRHFQPRRFDWRKLLWLVIAVAALGVLAVLVGLSA